MDMLPCAAMRVIPVLLGVLALAGCGGSEDNGSPTVVAAFYPLAWAAERIGDDAVVVNLTPPGAEPHDVELSPRDVETIRNADLVVYVGGGFQPAVEDAVREREGPSLDVLREGETDPHVWLDPVRFGMIAEQIGIALALPDAGRGLARGLSGPHKAYEFGLEDCKRRTIVTTHAAFGRLAARYGLTQLSLAGRSPEAEPGPRAIERLVESVRESGATTVFTEPLVSGRLAQTVAREAGVEVAVLDPIEGLSEERLAAGEDYLTIMRDNLATLREALGCR